MIFKHYDLQTSHDHVLEFMYYKVITTCLKNLVENKVRKPETLRRFLRCIEPYQQPTVV